MATAPIGPLAWEPPYAAGAAQEIATTKDKKTKKQKTKNKKLSGSSHCGTVETNPTRNHEVASLIPGLAQSVKDPVLPGATV